MPLIASDCLRQGRPGAAAGGEKALPLPPLALLTRITADVSFTAALTPSSPSHSQVEAKKRAELAAEVSGIKNSLDEVLKLLKAQSLGVGARQV